MLGIRIISLEIHGPRGPRLIDLDHSLVVVHGPSNTGKTSLADAISHCLGQPVRWKKAFERYVTKCSLHVRIGANDYLLHRTLGKTGSEIEIREIDQETSTRVIVKASKNDPRPTFSDWILTKLMIKDDLDPGEIKAIGSKSGRLTFNDLWPYLYRMQSEIDRQIIVHPGSKDSTRKRLFEILFGLSSTEIRLLDAQINEAQKSRREQEKNASAVESFFADSRTSPEQASVENETLQRELRKTEERLRGARAEVTTWEKHLKLLRGRCEKAQREWRRAAAEVNRARARHSARVGPTGTGVTPSCCTACGQGISRGRAGEGSCDLCLQGLPPHLPGKAITSPESELDLAEKRLDQAFMALEEALGRLRAHEEADPVPTRSVITTLHGQLSAHKERLEQLSEKMEQSRKLQELRAGANTAREEVEHLKRSLENEKIRLTNRNMILKKIDLCFHKEIKMMEVPWFNDSASLDRKSYLPLVDSQSFDQIGGGVKAAINVAYSLALLSYKVDPAGDDTFQPLLPSFLIVDAIRKNIGSNKEDQDFSDRIYERAARVGRYFSAHPTRGQVIILDNDEPSKEEMKANDFKKIKLSYEEPLIPGVSHADTNENPFA
ncbi:AAA family ATPase [Nocardiopsis alba]|uniref:AAA family ATPase n=1 Tax=Nocardiopsis alba TaxID=53437 RepID=UPI0033AF0455